MLRYITPFCGSNHQSPQDHRRRSSIREPECPAESRETSEKKAGEQRTERSCPVRQGNMVRQKPIAFLVFACIAVVLALPQQPKSKRPVPVFKNKPTGGLELPDNATLIRDNIVDTFSCKDRIYGYYADMENECQIFHVCLPQSRGSMRWSFICPAETVFNQATFVCTRTENSIPCEESEKYYSLNEEIGKEFEEEEEDLQESAKSDSESAEVTSKKPTARTSRIFRRGKKQ